MGLTLTAPPSKSYAIRALAAGLLAGPETVLHNLGNADDVKAARGCVEALHRGDKILHAGESALTARLFLPIAQLFGNDITIETSGSLRNRPMQQVELTGGEMHIDGSLSSQFVSGLLMALPCIGRDTELHVENPVSTPYIEMTLEVVRQFGVQIHHSGDQIYHIPGGQRYRPTEYTVEGDWSAASILLVAAHVAGKRLEVNGLNPNSLQPDRRILEVLRTDTSFTFDATDCPDLIPALVVLAAQRQGVSTILGASRLIHKESNRAEALQQEFAKLGVEIFTKNDIIRLEAPSEGIRGAIVDSHNDHRIVMALGATGLVSNGAVTVLEPECVAKSFPGFWEALDKIKRS